LTYVGIEGNPKVSMTTMRHCFIDGTDNDWVYFVIEGNFTADDKKHHNPITTAHPIHFHGHDFVVLA
jgi:hypothetical protein